MQLAEVFTIPVGLKGAAELAFQAIWAGHTLHLMLACPKCGRESPEGFRFCPHCATAFGPAVVSAAEERKVVSVLFADLVGFTARSDRADPEDVRASLHPYHARVKREIERFGGTVEKFVGDAVMAVFGAPTAHEDDAERAVRAALRIPDTVAELSQTTPGPELAVRVAVNTGEALVALGARPEEGEGIVTGDVVNTAARLQQDAPVGGVVVGEITYRATRSAIEYEELEPIPVKGKAEPVPIWRAIHARSRYGVDAEGVGPAFIGREEDLAFLQQAFARTLRDSSVQMVTLTGEPGVGKTRLVREFFRYVDDLPGLYYWRQGRCLAYGENVTFWALGEVVKAQAGVLESDGPGEAEEKLRRAVEQAVEDPSERDWVAARLAPLVGAEGSGGAAPAEQDESSAAWCRFLEGVASLQPLILVVEDLHWADQALLAFLDHLVDWSTGVPILVICTARPELYETSPGWGGGKRNASTISLLPLSPEDTARLIAALLEQAVLPVETQAALLERSGGNPLYTEQFVAMLIDRGLLVRGRRGWDIVADAEIPVPESIQSIIAARLDTLQPERKSLVHDASVVGKVFWSGALAAMGDIDERTAAEGLHELARKELVRPARRSSVEGQAEYAFWHALTREVAYSQIPRAGRAAKHRAAAAWIEGLAGDRVTDHAEFLAHHYVRALELTTASGSTDAHELEGLEERARHFLVMAGDRAAWLDPVRAESFYEQALGLFPEDHRERPVVLVKATDAGWNTGRLRNVEAEARYRAAIQRFLAQGDRIRAGDTMVTLSRPVWSSGETAEAMRLVIEAVGLLEPEGPGPELAEAYASLGSRKVLGGQIEDSLTWSGKALELGEALDLPAVITRAFQNRGMARSSMGDLDGVADLREGLRVALSSGLAWHIANAYVNLSFFLWLTEGPAAALATHQQCIDFCTRRGLAGNVNWATAETCWFLFDVGEWDELIRVADRMSAIGFQMAVSAVAYGAMVRAYRGEGDGLAATEAEFLARARHIRDPQILVPALGVAVVIEHAAGRPESAVRLVHELHNAMTAGPGTFDVALFLPEALRASASAGELDLGDRLLGAVDVHTPRHRHCLLTGRAILVEARDDLDEASALYREAAARWEEYGHVPERAQALLGLGRCLVQLGAGVEASAPLGDARTVFGHLRARPLLEETNAWLARATALTS
jgi:class 3 adenylate cyclase/tetratricopeptide (TPR) repeat protein